MEEEKKQLSKKVSRRKFVKASIGAGAGLTAAALTTNPLKTGTAYASNMMNTSHDDMPIKITDEYQRMDQKNTVFMRNSWDKELQARIKKIKDEFKLSGEPGWTQRDKALEQAAWSVERFGGARASLGVHDMGLYSWENPVTPVNPEKEKFNSPEEAASIIKTAAKFLGASIVGIAPFDERWVYSDWWSPFEQKSMPAEFPFKPKSVIAIAIAMDYEGFKCAPSLIASATAANGYSDMAQTVHKLSTFLHYLGYEAIPSGNDSAMSIPIAIQAGLGELSRAGIIITEEFGPRVRLCKVFTDLEMAFDKPKSFGVKEFCEVCMKCADECPSGAISRDKKMSFDTHNISNNPGAEKWYTDGEKCFEFWTEVGGDCGNCIGCCPYNKTEDWHHELSLFATKTPFKPVLKGLDDFFGYGKTYNTEEMKKFWKK